MLPSAVAAHSGAYWDVVASSALLNLPAAPGFGNLGKSFLIENLLRGGGSPAHGLPPPPLQGPTTALAPAAGAQLRPLPASPVPLKLCPAAEQLSPAGAPYGTRWAFQMLSPTADGARLPGRAPVDRDCAFQPSVPGEPALPAQTRPRPEDGARGCGVARVRMVPRERRPSTFLERDKLQWRCHVGGKEGTPSHPATFFPVPSFNRWQGYLDFLD
jgi:hypothetical protein